MSQPESGVAFCCLKMTAGAGKIHDPPRKMESGFKRHERKGVQFESAFHLGQALVHPAHRAQKIGIPVMAGRVVRIELQGALESAFGGRIVPLPKVNISERDMRFGQRAMKGMRCPPSQASDL